MTAERVVAALERGRTSWLTPLIAAALAVLPAIHWRVPDERGVPLAAAWAVVALIGAIAVAGFRGRRPTAAEITFVVVAAAVVVGDVTLLPTLPLRDLDVYLRAGDAWAAGHAVYLDHLVTDVPLDRSLYPFHYPPLTLPFFGALAALPRGIVHVAWPLASMSLAVLALGTLGLPRRWAIAALLWRPFAEGLWVGNVAVPLLAAFAFAPRAGILTAVPGLFKVYAAIPALWLLRERRWRSVIAAVSLAAGLAVMTLPLVGVASWRAWIAGLGWWDASTGNLGAYASGVALDQWLSAPVAVALVAAIILVALRTPGREGLWRLGVATPIASPAVFSHGLLTALPSLLGLHPAILCLALAATAAAPGPVFWLAPALAIASWFVPALRSGTTRYEPPSS